MRFLIHCQDRPHSLELRQATRPRHLEYMSQFDVLIGGALLDEDANPCGSALMVDLPDLAAAEEFVAGDPYNQAGLFETVLIRAFNTVVWPVAEGTR